MSEKKGSFLSKFLRGIVITLIILTTAITIISAVGTVCVAFNAEKFKEMAPLVPYKSLYKLFLAVSFAAGIWGVIAITGLFRGKENAFRNTLLFLLIGAISAGAQMATSFAIYGKTAPINIRVYLTVFTLLVIFILRLPPVRKIGDFTQKGGKTKSLSAGIAFIICSILIFTTRIWVGLSHISGNGEYWVDVLKMPLVVAGWGMMLAGVFLVVLASEELNRFKRFKPLSDVQSHKI